MADRRSAKEIFGDARELPLGKPRIFRGAECAGDAMLHKRVRRSCAGTLAPASS